MLHLKELEYETCYPTAEHEPFINGIKGIFLNWVTDLLSFFFYLQCKATEEAVLSFKYVYVHSPSL